MLHLGLFSFFNGLESKGTNPGSRPRRSIGGEKNGRRKKEKRNGAEESYRDTKI